MTDAAQAPVGNTGDILNWPMLKIVYRTDADRIAALLPPGIEPGASTETMLVTTDSFDEYEQEMSGSIDSDRQMKESITSTISEIQEDVVQDDSTTSTTADPGESEKNLSLDDAEMVRLFLYGIACFFHKFGLHINIVH